MIPAGKARSLIDAGNDSPAAIWRIDAQGLIYDAVTTFSRTAIPITSRRLCSPGSSDCAGAEVDLIEGRVSARPLPRMMHGTGTGRPRFRTVMSSR